MRLLDELLDFLTNKMSMQTIYQPAVILYLLTQGGVASRTELARVLSGYDDRDLGFWDKTLMDNPKRALVGKHQILNYDKSNQIFSLNFDLGNSDKVEQAKAVCIQKIEDWIQKEATSQRIPDEEVLWLNRVLELAHRGNQYHFHERNLELEEFAMGVVLEKLNQNYPNSKITQQPYSQLGFDILVGTPDQPTAYVKVKSTEALQPVFQLSEGERRFSIDHSKHYVLVLVYAVNLSEGSYQFVWNQGAIQVKQFGLTPLQWRAKLFN